ncbi:MAG: ABC transporter ATP-binding protein [Burkholderiales bacterium]|jgi:multiple sugar transport system ATP-binding protein
MAVVDLQNITKRYEGGTEAAVRDMSLEVADGEFMVLLGPSGCGKSTALRMIAGLESISEGGVSIDGVRMNGVPAKDRDIAMVFQSYALYPHMNVRDNMAFGLRRRGLPRADVDRAVNDAAALLGLTPYLERKPYALSGGQRQRVALGRAIVRKPKVFLFDEPLSNLDAALRVSMRGELIKLHQRLSATMIYVTHDQVEAMTMGTRICIMQAGRVVQIGAPLEIYRHPVNTFVAAFLGNPPMNLLPARLEADGAALAVRIGDTRLELPRGCIDAYRRHTGRNLILGLRPEEITESDGASDAVSLPTRVVAVEPLGAETLLVLAPEGSEIELVARVNRDSRARAGDSTRVRLNLAAMHLFDPATTEVIPTQ